MRVHLRIEPPGSVEAFDREVRGSEIVIGRSATAGLVVPDSSVSRQHARLFHRDDRWWVEDLGTVNGTRLNGQPLSAPKNLHPGDCIGVGETNIRVVVTEPTVALAAAPGAPTSLDPPAPAVERDRQAARLRALNEIHRALATPISLSALLDLILERCFVVLHPEEGVILLRGKDGEMRAAATRRLSEAAGEIFISRRIVDEVAGKGTAALVLDAAMDTRFSGSESIMMSGVKSVVAAPLTDADGTIGLIALCSRVSVRQFEPPDLEMLVSLASAAALRVRNVALTEEAAARRVLEHELSLAHDMQMAMLPRRLPDRPEVELAASLTPAHSVGGDLYDFVADEDRLWFIVADVSGKGVAAALYMAVAKTLFRAIVQARIGVSEVLARMNRELCRDNDQLMFVTAIVGHLTMSTGETVMADAGHNPVLLLGHAGGVTKVALSKGVALGVVEDFAFSEQTVTLEPGGALVVYTDGATDARSPSGELFGATRLEEAVASVVMSPVDAIVETIVRKVGAFEDGTPPEDDLTILALRYRGPLRASLPFALARG